MKNFVVFIMFFLIFCLSSANASIIAYYSFDHHLYPGYDESGNGNWLTLTSSWKSVPGIYGDAIQIKYSPKKSRYVGTSEMEYSIENGFSVEYWFYTGSKSGKVNVRDGELGRSSHGETFELKYKPSNKKASFIVYPEIGHPVTLTTKLSYKPSTWIHLLGVYDPIDYKISLYVNDILKDSEIMSEPMKEKVGSSFYIYGNSRCPHHGYIDEVKLQNNIIPEPAIIILLIIGAISMLKRSRA